MRWKDDKKRYLCGHILSKKKLGSILVSPIPTCATKEITNTEYPCYMSCILLFQLICYNDYPLKL